MKRLLTASFAITVFMISFSAQSAWPAKKWPLRREKSGAGVSRSDTVNIVTADKKSGPKQQIFACSYFGDFNKNGSLEASEFVGVRDEVSVGEPFLLVVLPKIKAGRALDTTVYGVGGQRITNNLTAARIDEDVIAQEYTLLRPGYYTFSCASEGKHVATAHVRVVPSAHKPDAWISTRILGTWVYGRLDETEKQKTISYTADGRWQAISLSTDGDEKGSTRGGTWRVKDGHVIHRVTSVSKGQSKALRGYAIDIRVLTATECVYVGSDGGVASMFRVTGSAETK